MYACVETRAALLVPDSQVTTLGNSRFTQSLLGFQGEQDLCQLVGQACALFYIKTNMCFTLG